MALTVGPGPRLHEIAALPGTDADVDRRLAVERRSKLDSRQIFATSVQSGPTLVAGRPKLLFEPAGFLIYGSGRPYDIASDRRFLIIRSERMEPGCGTALNMIVVQTRFEELERRVPVH
jgi:hypothetical protein